MQNNPSLFTYTTKGAGRPQILLYGNGLERIEGQLKWDELLNCLRAPGVEPLGKSDPRRNIPFPLLYQLLSTPKPAPSTLTKEDIADEERRLKKGLGKLKEEPVPLLDRLTCLGADHILTTNYSYCLERAFFPKRDFSKNHARTDARFCLLPPKNGRQWSETYYRLHTGYLGRDAQGSPVGLWHIHGETSASRGVVVGHDRYGRLLGRIQDCCAAHRYRDKPEDAKTKAFTSWPELFLFGDVYIIGLGFETCETDLWWLLRRKQRERHADGRVYFYDNDPDGKHGLRDQLLTSHGVLINHEVDKVPEDYETFYQNALDGIERKMRKNRGER